jgi:hypothetical protein
MDRLLRLLPPFFLRLSSFVGGVLIIYHEVWISQSAEPLLVVVGLWLAGAPVADLLDQLRRLANQVPSGEDEKHEARKPKSERRSGHPK